MTRRELLAGALVLPWLVSCGADPQPGPNGLAPNSPGAENPSPNSPGPGSPSPSPSPSPSSQSPASPVPDRPSSSGPTSSSPPSSDPPSTRPPLGSDRPAHENPGAALALEDGIIASRFWPGKRVHWRLARPVSTGSLVEPAPLVVALHGHGGNADWAFKRAHLDRYVVGTGLAVASVDGGNFYWHARRSGVDPARLLIRDLLPLLGRKGLDVERIGLIGWSMGGYGALLLASRFGPRRVAGVVAVSSALWQSPGAGGTDAFDGYSDFVRNDVFAARSRLRRIPVRLDCGLGDQFIGANQLFASGLTSAATTFDRGGHTEEYWRAHAGAQMEWLRRRFQ
jgi:pimeloyl-ACP methyl ester carboxylesterase